MKKCIALIFIVLPFLLFGQTSIYDIQYTTDVGPDGWSYPSPYNGSSVTTGGIVTAINYSGGRYFIECSNGGAWNGLFVYDNYYSPAIGDSIVITGTIVEYQGYTEIKSLTAYSKISSGNTLPPATKITSTQVGWEPYEGLLVEVNNGSVSEVLGTSGSFKIDDGSGEAEVLTGIFNINDIGFPLLYNYPFERVAGVVGVYNSERKLHPRSIDDLVSASNEFVLSTDDKFALTTASFSYPVKIGILNQSNTITSYSLKLQYDNTKFEYESFTQTGSISESGSVTDNSTAGNIELNFTGNISCNNVSTLIYLNLKPLAGGDANLQFNMPTINGSEVSYVSAGMVEYGSDECDIPIGDTLTIVQRPLLNIPSIVVPEEEFNIVCFAPQSTTSWAAELFYKDIVVPLNITQTNYDSDLEKWTLTTVIPDVDIYELYDLRVTASDGIIDSVTNAVKVIDQYKDDYYFVHITDTHLPGHTFYGAAGYETDESEMDDLYEVIKDINLINPEFVLLTGDLVNESELEDFECLRNHTLAVQMLEKFEVPVYLVPGNHDLGGWDLTPPPTGTARKEWWRFFGWRQREIPPTETEYFSHDYSFNYGNVHFAGLEAYETDGNYDDYMFDVYGNTSFTASQISWLNADLAAAGEMTKVLFYHYDFKNELDLSALGVDMALWGHYHSNIGDIDSHPYNLSTAATCDESRTYRVVRVNGSDVQAENSVQTHSSGDMLTNTFNMVNDGSLDLVSATVQNNHSLSFNHGLIKFIMPLSDYGYNITNGRLIQILDNGSNATCYVEVTIPANGQVTATIEKKTSNNITSIYDIQHTTEAGDGSYPSTLNGQTINTGGIVTAVNYYGGQYFISSSNGGEWSGILVYDDNYSPSIGDSILITGKVTEYNGYTELTNLSSYEVVAESNTLPETEKITTTQVLWEAYEGVLVEIEDCYVSGDFNEEGTWMINDGSGDCEIRYGIYSLMYDEFTLINNYPFNYIIGVVGTNANHNTIHPRGLSDIQSADDGFILITEDKSVSDNSNVSVPVKLSIIKPYQDISNYTLKVQYNSEVFQYDGYDKTNTISESGSITDNSTEGNIELIYSGTTTCEKTEALAKLNFTPISSGSANIQFSGTSINGYDLEYSVIGDLESTYENSTYIGTLGANSLFKCYPNPFSEEIRMEYEISQKANVNIAIYNSAGQRIKILVDEIKNAGKYSIKWDGTTPSGNKVEDGVYFYKYVVNGKQIATSQIVFIK